MAESVAHQPIVTGLGMAANENQRTLAESFSAQGGATLYQESAKSLLLSGANPRAERIGREATGMLDRLINGESLDTRWPTFCGRFAMIRSMNANDPCSALDPATAQHMLDGAIGQIKFARDYTLQLLDATPKDRWFEIPTGLPSNIVWQVGHLTVSQYGLLLFRIRGRLPDDLTLIPSRFRKTYSRESTPSDDRSRQPSSDELVDRMCQVYDLGIAGLSKLTPEVLLEPIEMPYAAYPNKLGAILFCPLHEHIHAGQIGLVRRALGLAPVR